ncbi:MAG TPA: glycosyltransferase 87 family protein [Ktedonobacterales bacterium]
MASGQQDETQRARPRWARWLRLSLEMALVVAAVAVVRALMVATTRLPNGDVTEYHTYALAFWTHPPLFRSLPIEYPPLAILPFTLTLLPPLKDFQSVFAWWMGAATLVGYLAFRRVSGRRRALAYLVYLLIGAAGTLVARFDIFPALTTVGALWAAQRRRFSLAYLLLAAGALLKLYPAFLAPLVVIEQWRSLAAEQGETGLWPERWRDWRGWLARDRWARIARARATRGAACGAGLLVGVVALGFLIALALDPVGALSEFHYAGARPLQIESTPAALLWLASLVGIPAHADFSYVSLNLVGPLDVVLKPLSSLALAAGCLWVYARLARGRLGLAQAFLALLCVVTVANKIFSPQYMIWVTPFVAEVYGFDLLWLLICGLTTLIFPYLYALGRPIWVVPTVVKAFLPAVALRDGLMVAATLRAVLRPARGAQNPEPAVAQPAAAPVEPVESTPPGAAWER